MSRLSSIGKPGGTDERDTNFFVDPARTSVNLTGVVARRSPHPTNHTMTLWLLGNQLSIDAAPLANTDEVLLIESYEFAERLPYHPTS